MNRIEYFNKCQRTCPDLGSKEKNIDHMALGINTEFGELFDIYKKEMAYGKPIDRPNLIEEFADVSWYMFNALRFLAPYPGLAEDLLKEGNQIVESSEHADMLLEMLEQSFADKEPIYKTLMYVEKSIKELNTDLFGYKYIDIVSDVDSACKLVATILLWEEIMKFIGIDPTEAYARNISKLLVRFPEKFSEIDALVRDLESERKTLE